MLIILLLANVQSVWFQTSLLPLVCQYLENLMLFKKNLDLLGNKFLNWIGPERIFLAKSFLKVR